MLTDDQVTRMRATAEAAMPDEATVLRLTQTYDGGGGYNEAWVEGDTYPCSIGAPLGGESDERNNTRTIVVDESQATFRFPAKADIQTTDRLRTPDNRVWEVNAVQIRGAWEIARDVKVTEYVG
jgi:hypothetical protein